MTELTQEDFDYVRKALNSAKPKNPYPMCWIDLDGCWKIEKEGGPKISVPMGPVEP